MLNGQTELTNCFFVCLVTFLVFGTHTGTRSNLRAARATRETFQCSSVPFKNNFRKNCRLLTNSHKNLNTMLSLCYLYIYIYIRGRYVGTIPSSLAGAARLASRSSWCVIFFLQEHMAKHIKTIFYR